jgi:hypothetical protein
MVDWLPMGLRSELGAIEFMARLYRRGRDPDMVEAAEFHFKFSIAASLRALRVRGNPENGFTRKREEERKPRR